MNNEISAKSFVEMVEKMTVLELSEVVKALEDRFGVASTPMMAAAPVAAAAAVEEKTEFNVILESVGDKKMDVIKIVKNLTGLGLKEAKDIVDTAPKEIKANVPTAEAKDMQKQLAEVGAVVKLV